MCRSSDWDVNSRQPTSRGEERGAARRSRGRGVVGRGELTAAREHKRSALRRIRRTQLM